MRIGDFLCYAVTNFFVIRTDWFFSLGINFCDFQKVSSTRSIDNISFLLSIMCNRNTFFQTVLQYAYPITSNSLYTVLFLNEGGKL